MSRFLIGLGLMAVLLGVGLYGAYAIEKSHEPIAAVLEQAALEGDPALLEEAKAQWESRWHGTAVLADHGPMDEIDSLFAQAQAYARAGDTRELSALCLKLAQLIRAAADEHQPTWWNFLSCMLHDNE